MPATGKLPVHESCADTIARARKAAGLTLAQLAARTGVRKSYLSALERGKLPMPHWQTATVLARALDIDAFQFVFLNWVEKAPAPLKDLAKALAGLYHSRRDAFRDLERDLSRIRKRALSKRSRKNDAPRGAGQVSETGRRLRRDGNPVRRHAGVGA